MTKISIFSFLFIIACNPGSFGQTTGGMKNSDQVVAAGNYRNYDQKIKRGTFFLSPFYQYTNFRQLKLTAHSNDFKMAEGNSFYEFSGQEIDEYNDNFGTEYVNRLFGLRIGYQVTEHLGISLMTGVNHFDLKTWISDSGHESVATRLPSFTYGITADYAATISGRVIGIAVASFNRCQTGKPETQITSGANVLKSAAASSSLELNLAAGYRLRNFIPYAGTGFSQQYIHSERTEIMTDMNEQGKTIENYYIFDSKFRGSSVYCFAGAEYNANRYLSFYLRAAFPNPSRFTFGIRIII